MIPWKSIQDNVLEAMHRMPSKEMRERIKRVGNEQYFDICRGFPFMALRAKVTIDLTDSTYSEGMFLPSDLFGIRRVRSTTDDLEYVEKGREDAVEADDNAFRYYRYVPSMEPVFRGEDLVLSNGATTFTSASLVTRIADTATDPDVVDGEYLMVGGELGFYEIDSDTSPFTITVPFYGPDISQGIFYVRPAPTEKIVALDPAENALTDRSIDVYYWKAPRTLYNDEDMCILPSSRVLELKILKAIPEAKALRPVSQGEIDEAMREVTARTPIDPRENKPRDRNNNPFDLRNNPYTDR